MDNRASEAGAGWPARLARAQSALCCPQCRSPLAFSPAGARCGACPADYSLRNGRLYFAAPPPAADELDKLKATLKRRLGALYYSVGVKWLGPTFPFDFGKAVRRHSDPAKQLVVDLGSGNSRVDPDIVCVDAVDYDAVDIVCDLGRLPFRDGSVDAFVSRSAIEHLPDPAAVVSGLERCTRSGGVGVHLIPFLYPFHASPDDYQRFTHAGAAALFAGWDLLEQRNASGPATLAVLVLVEFFSALLSFGNERARAALNLLLCLCFFPLKFLDAPFVGRRSMLALAPTILTVVRKP